MQSRHFNKGHHHANKHPHVTKKATHKPSVIEKCDNRKSNIEAEERNHVEETRARLATIGASDIKTTPSDNLHIKNKKQAALVGMMTTACLLSLLPSGEAKQTAAKKTAEKKTTEQKTTEEKTPTQNKESRDNDINPDKYKANNGSVKPRVRKIEHQPSKVCQDVKPVGKQSFSFGCTPEAKAIYEKNPERYQKDVAVAHDILTKIGKEQSTHCKLQELGQDPRFHIALHPMDALRPSALYIAEDQEIQLRMDLTDSLMDQRLTKHEVHHASVSFRNRARKTPETTSLFCKTVKYPTDTVKNLQTPIPSYSSADDAGCGTPVSSYEELKIWKNIIVKAANKLVLLKSLLEKSPKQLKQVSRTKKKLLADFTQLANDYMPRTYTYTVSNELLNDWRNKGYLDHQNQPVTPVRISSNFNFEGHAFTATLHLHSLERNGHVHTAYGHLVNNANDRLQGALNDGLYHLASASIGRLGENEVAEVDAYPHELYTGPLLEFLFEGLEEYHSSRATPAYNNCMRP